MVLARAKRLFGAKAGRLDVTWITPEWAVGVAPPADLLPMVRQAGVNSVLDLRAEASPDPKAFVDHSLSFLHLPVRDGAAPTERQLAQGAAWVLSEIAAGRRVLICCRLGRGRSVTLACAVLLAMGYPLSQTLPMVAKRRVRAQPTTAQLAALQSFAADREQDKG